MWITRSDMTKKILKSKKKTNQINKVQNNIITDSP